MKRKLSIDEAQKAAEMLTKHHIPLGQVARYFRVNKPAVLKAVGAWNSEVQKAANGQVFQMHRGKVVYLKGEDTNK